MQVIVFSDNVWALENYARALKRPYVYGKTSHAERTLILAGFKHSSTSNTVFLSKVCSWRVLSAGACMCCVVAQSRSYTGHAVAVVGRHSVWFSAR
jgi:hypothetical protein